MTVKQNPTLKTYKLNIQIAIDNRRASLSYLMPTVLLNATAQDNFKIATTVINGSLLGQPNETLTMQLGAKYNYSAGLSANYTLFDWQKITEGRQAKNAIRLQEAQEAYYLQTLKNMAASLYFQSLVSLKAQEINRKDLELADTLIDIAAKKYNEGAVSLIDLNQSKINYNQIAQNLIASENLYESNLQQIRILLGLKPDEGIIIQGQLPDNIEEKEYRLGEDKLLETYLRMVKDAQYNLRIQQQAYAPTLSLNAYYGANQFQKTLDAFSFKSSYWHRQEYIGLSLTTTLFSGLENLNKIKAARKSFELAQMQSDIAELQSAINDRLLLEEIVRKGISAEKAAEAFFLYRDNLKMYHIQYQEGAIDLNTFLTYFQYYLIAENAYFSQLSSYYNDLSIIISRNQTETR